MAAAAGTGSFTPLRGYTSSVSLRLTPVSLRVGRFAGLTGHRPVIQHREPLKGKALGRVLLFMSLTRNSP